MDQTNPDLSAQYAASAEPDGPWEVAEGDPWITREAVDIDGMGLLEFDSDDYFIRHPSGRVERVDYRGRTVGFVGEDGLLVRVIASAVLTCANTIPQPRDVVHLVSDFLVELRRAGYLTDEAERVLCPDFREDLGAAVSTLEQE